MAGSGPERTGLIASERSERSTERSEASQVASVPRREATTPEPLVAFSSEVPLRETAGVVSRKRERRGLRKWKTQAN